MPFIELEGISKTYEVHKRPPGLLGALRGTLKREVVKVKALENISFSVEEGELVGYIGPNGAGKSTTVKVMSGILTPDEGRCQISGRIPWKQRAAHVAGIGVVFGQRSQLWWDNPVRDSLELLRDIYGVPQTDYRMRLGELCEELDTASLLETPVRQLSLGQRMRCELVAALLHNPSILFLDEPTIGLDAISKRALRAFLRRRNEQGITMVLTTHDMDDIEALCRRVMVIGHGRILFDGDMSGLREAYAPQHSLKAALTRPAPPIFIEGATVTSQTDYAIELTFNPNALPVQKLVAELATLCELRDFTVQETDVEEVVARLYEEMKL